MVVFVLLCYLIFSPFLTMMLWAFILAITIYPLHQMLAARIGGKHGLAATLIVLLGVGLIVTPTVMLASQFGDSVQTLIKNVRTNTLQVPAPSEKIAAWPVIGERYMPFGRGRTTICRGWFRACSPSLASWRPKH